MAKIAKLPQMKYQRRNTEHVAKLALFDVIRGGMPQPFHHSWQPKGLRDSSVLLGSHDATSRFDQLIVVSGVDCHLLHQLVQVCLRRL